MSNKFNSKMLAQFFFSALIIQAAWLANPNLSRADDCADFTYDEVKAASGNILCKDENGNQAIIIKAEVMDRFLAPGGQSKVVWKPVDKLTKKELKKYGLTITVSGGTAGNANGNGGGTTTTVTTTTTGGAGSGANGGGTTGGDTGNNGGGAGNGGGTAGNANGNGGGTTTTTTGGTGSGGGNGGGSTTTISGGGGVAPTHDHSGGGRGSITVTTTTRGGDTDYSGKKGKKARDAKLDLRTSTQVDVDTIGGLCPQAGSSRILDAIDLAKKEQDDTDAAIKKYTDKSSDGYIDLYGPSGEEHTAAQGCRNEYLTLALSTDDPCSWKSLGTSNQLAFCSYLSAADASSSDNGVKDKFNAFMGSFSGNQDACTQALTKNTTPDDQLFSSLMVKSKACMASLGKKVDNNELTCQALVDFVADQKDYQTLLARKKVLASKSDSSCAVNRATDAARFTDDKLSTLSVDCLDNISSSCDNALVNAVRVLSALPPSYCAECNQQAGAACLYGASCTSVSKGAQVVGAVGNLLGGLVPLGLGAMQMAEYNKGLATCVSTYNTYSTSMNTVGIPPQAPNCGGGGMGGFGMNGMGFGMNGMGMNGMNGGYNPFANSMGSGFGINGMGMNGMNGMSGGYNPFGSAMGMNGFGMNGLGMNGGMGMGMNGMTGPSGYNPFAGGMGMNNGMGMMGNGLGNGLGFGVNLGLGTGNPYASYNPYAASANPYAALMGGGGAGFGLNGSLGMSNPYTNMYSNPYSANMYTGQSNLMGAQQQVYLDQERMQEISAQNMAAQYSSMNGYNLGGQYGMGTPYYGPSATASYNPYSSGFSSYSPYSSYGTGLSAGINMGFNTSPYAATNYGSYNPNAGLYAQAGTTSNCGYYTAGVPCY